jgi:hypothetical protein
MDEDLDRAIDAVSAANAPSTSSSGKRWVTSGARSRIPSRTRSLIPTSVAMSQESSAMRERLAAHLVGGALELTWNLTRDRQRCYGARASTKASSVQISISRHQRHGRVRGSEDKAGRIHTWHECGFPTQGGQGVTVKLAAVTLDCEDALTVGRFWSAALGRPSTRTPRATLPPSA